MPAPTPSWPDSFRPPMQPLGPRGGRWGAGAAPMGARNESGHDEGGDEGRARPTDGTVSPEIVTMPGVGVALALFMWQVTNRLDRRIDRLEGRVDGIARDRQSLAREFAELRGPGAIRGRPIEAPAAPSADTGWIVGLTEESGSNRVGTPAFRGVVIRPEAAIRSDAFRAGARYRRSVAQSGSALDWGSRGRRFKSYRSDQRNQGFGAHRQAPDPLAAVAPA